MSLADSLADWRPGVVEMARSVDPWPAAAFAGLIGAPEPALKDGNWHGELATDPVLLFRFSALTYNGHRIHYDLPYATGEEGYPGLVIHGPLLALLALDLPRVHAPDATLTSFEYRLVRPAFASATIVAAGQPAPDGMVKLTVSAVGAEPSLTATAVVA